MKKILIFLMLTVMVIAASFSSMAAEKEIIVGSKQFTEQLIVGQIAIQLLEDRGFAVSDKTGLGGSTVCREALKSNDIDMYWEYTGTAWMAYLGHDKPITDPEEAYKKVKEED